MMKRLIDFIESSSSQITVIERAPSEKRVLKKYSGGVGLIKWFIIKAATIPVPLYPIAFNPRVRMQRELSFFEYMGKYMKTPKIYEVSWDELSVEREYIVGEPVYVNDEEDVFIKLGRALGLVHSHERALGDSKCSNFVVSSSGDVVIVDAEQAIETTNTEHYAWDIVVLIATLSYTINNILNVGEFKNRVKPILESYVSTYYASTLKAIADDARLKAFLSITTPTPFNFAALEVIKETIA
ncbi:MAG: hypothetical protein QXN38_02500 [Desulfurococcaceae archaeon]